MLFRDSGLFTPVVVGIAALAALTYRRVTDGDETTKPQTIFHTADCKSNLDSLRLTYRGKRIEGERLQQFVLWLERDEQVRRRCDEFFSRRD